jgi:Rrf2 family iron-sulfur cluster assembly transcriptional regulator
MPWNGACANWKAGKRTVNDMRMSSKAQYAVRAMVRLSLESPETPVSSKIIAEREGISLAFLEQILSKLRRADIIRSVRGPGGGFVLARPAGQIRMDEIIESVDEPLMPVSCMDEAGQCNCEEPCGCDEKCHTHAVWAGLGKRIKNFLASITLAELTCDSGAMVADAPDVQEF